MSEPLKLGIAGLGTVGSGLLQLLQKHGARVAGMVGADIKVTGISARSRGKDRGVPLDDVSWFDDAVELARHPSNNVFVELIGGEDGPAKAAVEAALHARKNVVTANKALLAKHGFELARLAENNGVALNFEAAVAGGIPVIKTLREALCANEITRVYGILNGTCNYILTKMLDEKRAFADVLEEAKDKGYAEADPTFDIGGFDTAHKLTLLTSLAFGTRVAYDQIHIEGIESITEADIEAAQDLGYCIKLLGVATRTESGIEARVSPAMVPEESSIAEVSGVTNCVAIEGDYCGSLLLVGAGAGSKATASAVASDILDIARGLVLPPFVTPSADLKPHKRAKLDQHKGAYYVRLSVFDKPGAMAAIAKRMGDRDVSIESIVQRRPKPETPDQQGRPVVGVPVHVIMVTHETTEDNIRKALEEIEKDGKVAARPQMIRIETL